jgi:hypothetical protein
MVYTGSKACTACISGENYCQNSKMAQCPKGTYSNSSITGYTETCAEGLDQQIFVLNGAAPYNSIYDHWCYKRGNNLQYVYNLTYNVRFPHYDYQTCDDCNTTALKDSICTFGGIYFTS